MFDTEKKKKKERLYRPEAKRFFYFPLLINYEKF